MDGLKLKPGDMISFGTIAQLADEPVEKRNDDAHDPFIDGNISLGEDDFINTSEPETKESEFNKKLGIASALHEMKRSMLFYEQSKERDIRALADVIMISPEVFKIANDDEWNRLNELSKEIIEILQGVMERRFTNLKTVFEKL